MEDNANACQCRIIDQFQSEVGNLRGQNSSLFEKLMGHITQNSTYFLGRRNQNFFLNFLIATLTIVYFQTAYTIEYGNLIFLMILGFILIPLQPLLIWDKQSSSDRQEQNVNHSSFMPATIVLIMLFQGLPQHQPILCETVTNA